MNTMQTLPPELQEVVDRQKIYDVLTRYCRALDTLYQAGFVQKTPGPTVSPAP